MNPKALAFIAFTAVLLAASVASAAATASVASIVLGALAMCTTGLAVLHAKN